MHLSEVMRLGRAAERRAELRRMATPRLEPYAARIRSAIKASPLVGDRTDQIKVAPTVSGLRDQLSEDVLLALIACEIHCEQVLDAVLFPALHSYPSSSSKTGYAFGHPIYLTDTLINTIINRASAGDYDTPTTASTTAKENPMNDIQQLINDASLEALINTVDAVHVTRGIAYDKIMDAMLDLSGRVPLLMDRIAGVDAAIKARGTTPTEIFNPYIPALHQNILHQLGAAGEAKVAQHGGKGGIAKVPPENEAILNAVLSAAKLPPINDLINRLNANEQEVIELRTKLDEVKAKPSASVVLMPVGTTIAAPASGTLPAGKVMTKPAREVFNVPKGMSFDFDVPVWEWDHPHPYVPEVDEDYIFRPKELLAALYSLIAGDRAWTSGHTGTGKTTLWEQIGARLKWPVRVLSLESEITRADLIGQHILVNDGGVTISKFVEGILPFCMQQPIILVCDELDYIRPDVAYVMQRVAEAKGLTLTEDGGRLVMPHLMFRLVATANTEGQGDDYGMYAGARVQSSAFLDRFTNWIRVDYLTAEQRLALLKKKVPHLDDPTAEQVNKYTTEHIEAFKSAKVMKPISPRGMIALGTRIANYLAIMPAKARREALAQALEGSVLNACTQQDRAVLKGIADRVFV